MRYVYLLCSRHSTLERTGIEPSVFTDSEIENAIFELHSKEFSDSERDHPFIISCFSSSKKAFDARNRFNSIDEYTRFVSSYKNLDGLVYSRKLCVYDYYVIGRVLE